jgi:hypothetical protein
MQLKPSSRYAVTCTREDAKDMVKADSLTTDAGGVLSCDLPGAAKGSKLIVDCVRK